MRNIDVKWRPPLQLVDSTPPLYVCPGLEEVPQTPGVYVFARVRGEKYEPLYIGLAKQLRGRTAQHLRSSELMNGIRRRPGGRRVLMIGELQDAPTRGLRTILASIENALIHHAVAERWLIRNKRGRIRHTYMFVHTGSRTAREWLPRQMPAEQVKRRERGAHGWSNGQASYASVRALLFSDT